MQHLTKKVLYHKKLWCYPNSKCDVGLCSEILIFYFKFVCFFLQITMRMKRLLSRKMHELTRLHEELHLTTTTKWENLLFTSGKTTERWEYGNSLNKISEAAGTTNHCGLEGYRENLKSCFTPPGM